MQIPFRYTVASLVLVALGTLMGAIPGEIMLYNSLAAVLVYATQASHDNVAMSAGILSVVLGAVGGAFVASRVSAQLRRTAAASQGMSERSKDPG